MNVHAVVVMQGVYLVRECTATCLEGFSFESGQRVVTKRCNKTSGQWEGDVAKLTCTSKNHYFHFLVEKNMFEALYMLVIVSYCFCRELTHLYKNYK